MENIIHLDFFDEMSSTMKHIYLAYSAAGGALYENYVTKNNVQVIAKCFVSLLFVLILIIKVLVIYRERGTFHALFDLMNKLKDDEFVGPKFNLTTDQIDETNVPKLSGKIIKYTWLYSLSFYSLQFLLKFIDYIQGREFYIDYKLDFLIAFPVLDTQKFSSFVIVQVIVDLFALFNPIILHGSICLPLLLSIHLQNQAIRLQNDMKYHTAVAFECLDECDRREEHILTESPKCEHVRNFQLRDIQRQRDRQVREFMHKVRQWIRFHQTWTSCVTLFNKLVSDLLTIQVTTSYFGLAGPGYSIAKMILDSQEMPFEHILIAFLNAIYILVNCIVAGTPSEMNDDISTAIYSMPWYHLPAEDQKTLLLFLTLTQNSQEIRIFKIFPLNLERYPDLLNDIYGKIQLARTLEMKRVW